MTDDNTGQPAVVIERVIDAPVELVWRMWVEPEHFAAWYGPDEVAVPVAKLDVRVGGTRFVCMEMPSPQGLVRMWFTGEYKEVVENRRLVYTESISDEHGNVADASAPGSHATSTEVRVELEDLGGRTRMVLTHVGIPAGSPGASGWAMAIDKLTIHAEAGGRG